MSKTAASEVSQAFINRFNQLQAEGRRRDLDQYTAGWNIAHARGGWEWRATSGRDHTALELEGFDLGREHVRLQREAFDNLARVE